MKSVKGNKIPKWYLILAIIIALMWIIQSLLAALKSEIFLYISDLFLYALGSIKEIWLILNLVMLIIFFTKKYEKISFVLPAYYITLYIFSILLFVFSIFKPDFIISLASVLKISNFVLLLFEVIFPTYLLFRK